LSLVESDLHYSSTEPRGNNRHRFPVTDHLLRNGCRRVVFIGLPDSAPTVMVRASGYSDAVCAAGLPPAVEIGSPSSPEWVSGIFRQHKADGFVCANDRTAGQLMLTLNALGIEIPTQVKIVGIDDVKYASLLHVPLTTLQQPCNDIGAAAVSTMIDRITHPNMPPREVQLNCKLVIRKSCGSPSSDSGSDQRL